jgi:hypothetical protein
MIALIRSLSNYLWRTCPQFFSIDGLAIRANLSDMATSTRRAAFYVRVATSDRGQAVENQLQPLQEAARRLVWSIVAVFRDESISGAQGVPSGLDWMRC